jgi:hypothetical protein
MTASFHNLSSSSFIYHIIRPYIRVRIHVTESFVKQPTKLVTSSVFNCSVWFSEWTAINSLNSVKQDVFVTEKHCVSCEVRTMFVNISQISGWKSVCSRLVDFGECWDGSQVQSYILPRAPHAVLPVWFHKIWNPLLERPRNNYTKLCNSTLVQASEG